jgi:hypothetical protein
MGTVAIETGPVLQGPMNMLSFRLAVVAIVAKLGHRFFQRFSCLPHMGVVAGHTTFLQSTMNMGQSLRGVVVALQAQIVTVGQQANFPGYRKIVAVLTILFHRLVELPSHIPLGRLFPGWIKGNKDTLPVDLKDVDTSFKYHGLTEGSVGEHLGDDPTTVKGDAGHIIRFTRQTEDSCCPKLHRGLVQGEDH